MDTSLKCCRVVATLSMQFIFLDIVPHVCSRYEMRILVFFVCESIYKNYIASSDLSAVNFLVGHGLLHKSVKLFDHLVADIRPYVPLTQCVCNFAEPGLAADQFWVDTVIRYDVHIVPPTIE